MPIFDFYCENCEADQEDVLVYDADKEIICQECGKPMKKRPPIFSFTMTSGSISKFKRKVGNTLPPEYKTSGGANIYGMPRST